MEGSLVRNFHEKFRQVMSSNYSNALWLEKYIAIFMQRGDKLNARKVWAVYNTYPDRLEMYRGHKPM